MQGRAGRIPVSRLITKYFEYREDNGEYLVIRDDEDALTVSLSEGIDRFGETGEVYSRQHQINEGSAPPQISLGVSVREGWLNLKVDAEG